MEHIGSRIKRARLEAGMTPKELAKALKLRSAEAVLAWERGKSQPRPSRYSAIADALGARIEYIQLGELPVRLSEVRDARAPRYETRPTELAMFNRLPRKQRDALVALIDSMLNPER